MGTTAEVPLDRTSDPKNPRVTDVLIDKIVVAKKKKISMDAIAVSMRTGQLPGLKINPPRPAPVPATKITVSGATKATKMGNDQISDLLQGPRRGLVFQAPQPVVATAGKMTIIDRSGAAIGTLMADEHPGLR